MRSLVAAHFLFWEDTMEKEIDWYGKYPYEKCMAKAYKLVYNRKYRKAEGLLYILRDLYGEKYPVHELYTIAATRNFGRNGLRFKNAHEILLMSYLLDEELLYLKQTGVDKYKKRADKILLYTENFRQTILDLKKYAKYFVN